MKYPNGFNPAETMKEAGNIIAKYGKAKKELQALLAIKREAQVILDDDTVNSWMTDKDATRKYTEAQVKQAAEDYNNSVKETDLIIEGL